MPARLTIGEFSRLSHLSVKTLRHYHDEGLLEPVAVDPQSGYRFYSTTQIPTAQIIRQLRELGVPVREVGQVINTDDPAARAELIADHLQRLETQLRQTQAAVRSLRRLLRPDPTELAVEFRSEPAQPVAAIGATLAPGEVIDWFDGAVAELGAAVGGRPRRGPLGGLYDSELFVEESGRAVLYLPVADPPEHGRVAPFDLPAVELATTVHTGSHDDINVTYGALGAYVSEHALGVDGPVRERYLVGPSEAADPSAWRTEIGLPVFTMATPARGPL